MNARNWESSKARCKNKLRHSLRRIGVFIVFWKLRRFFARLLQVFMFEKRTTPTANLSFRRTSRRTVLDLPSDILNLVPSLRHPSSTAFKYGRKSPALKHPLFVSLMTTNGAYGAHG